MPEPGVTRRVRRPDLPGLLLAVLLVASGGYLLVLAHQLWFFGDDWDFLLLRSVTGTSQLSLLQPHNEHWSTVPIVLFRAVFQGVGLRHYLPYAAMPVVAHLVTVGLLAVLLRRLGARPWVTVVAVAPVVVLGAGAENLLWDFQVGFIGPLPLALGAFLALERQRSPVRSLIVWVLLVLGLMCSGIGITMVVWVVVVTWIREGLRQAVVVGVVPALVYGAWYLRFGEAATDTGTAPFLRIVEATARGLDAVWSSVLVVPGSGTVVLLVLLAVALRSASDDRLRPLALGALAAMAAFYALVGYSRAGLGADAADGSRYVYVGIVLSIPALAIAVQQVADRLASRPRTASAVGVAFAVAAIAVGVVQAQEFQADRRIVLGDTRQVAIGGVALARNGDPLLTDQPDATYAPDLTISRLLSPGVRPALPAGAPPAATRLVAAGTLQVATSTSALDLPVAPRVRVVRLSGQSTDGAGCITGVAGTKSLVVLPRSEQGSQVRLTVAGRGITTRLARGGLRSEIEQRTVQPGVPTWIGTSAAGAELRIHPSLGDVTVCPAATGR